MNVRHFRIAPAGCFSPYGHMKRFLLLLLAANLGIIAATAEQSIWVIGREGISHTTLDESSGELGETKLAASFNGGSWLTQHPRSPILYATWGRTEVAAFRIGPDHSLELINRIELPAGAAAHVAVDDQGELLSIAHWGGKAVTLIALDASGAPRSDGLLTFEPRFERAGPRKVQTQSRPHWSKFTADGNHLHVTDLGGDRLWTFKVSREPLGLSVHSEIVFPAGFGPRHMDFDPTDSRAYVSGELSSEIATLVYDSSASLPSLNKIYATLGADDHEPENNTSEVRVHPSGRFVYIGNRGHDSIAVFSIDAESGTLTPVERESVRGIWPRNFNLDPSGQWMIVAGQYSDSLTVFAINEDSGELTFNRQLKSVQSPTRVLFERN